MDLLIRKEVKHSGAWQEKQSDLIPVKSGNFNNSSQPPPLKIRGFTNRLQGRLQDGGFSLYPTSITLNIRFNWENFFFFRIALIK